MGHSNINTSLTCLALAWLIAQPNSNAIVGARQPEQTTENAKAADIKLSDEDLAEMDRISRLVTDQLDQDPMMGKFAS